MTQTKHPWADLEGPKLLARWRARKGVSQASLARALELDPSQLNAFETGRQRPGLKIAVLIEDHTGIAPREWVES